MTANVNEDALTQLLGHPKSGRLLPQGRGVTKSRVSVHDICQAKMNMYEREQENMKTQLAEIMNILNGQMVRSLYMNNHTVNDYYE